MSSSLIVLCFVAYISVYHHVIFIAAKFYFKQGNGPPQLQIQATLLTGKKHSERQHKWLNAPQAEYWHCSNYVEKNPALAVQLSNGVIIQLAVDHIQDGTRCKWINNKRGIWHECVQGASEWSFSLYYRVLKLWMTRSPSKNPPHICQL